jgi:hypothetical protein
MNSRHTLRVTKVNVRYESATYTPNLYISHQPLSRSQHVQGVPVEDIFYLPVTQV